MHCPRCQARNAAGARFCEDCGARLALACPRCGADVSPGKRFCRSCGAALVGEAAAAPAPASYTPKHLAERTLTSKGALKGERKQVTVLFADLKGSMEFLADRDPEEARKLLDPVLERKMEAVHHYEGTCPARSPALPGFANRVTRPTRFASSATLAHNVSRPSPSRLTPPIAKRSP
jgi:hypothetical protein